GGVNDEGPDRETVGDRRRPGGADAELPLVGGQVGSLEADFVGPFQKLDRLGGDRRTVTAPVDEQRRRGNRAELNFELLGRGGARRRLDLLLDRLRGRPRWGGGRR